MPSAAVEAVQKAVEKALTDEEDDSFEKIDYINQQEPDDEDQKDKIARLERELADARRAIEYYNKECLTPPGLICVLITVVFLVTVGWHIFMNGACASSCPAFSLDSACPVAAPAPAFECPMITECPPVPKCEAAKCPMRTCGHEQRLKLENGDTLQLRDGYVVANVTGSAAQKLSIGRRIRFVNGEDTSKWKGERLITAGDGNTTDVELIFKDHGVIGDFFDDVGPMIMIFFLIPLVCSRRTSEDQAEREQTERPEAIVDPLLENSSNAINEDSEGHSDDASGEEDDDNDEDEEGEQESESEDGSNSEEEYNEEGTSDVANQQAELEDNEEGLESNEAAEAFASDEIEKQTIAIEDNKVELEMFQSRVASAHVDWMVLNAQVEMLKKTRDELIKKNAELEEKQKAPVEQCTWLEQTLDESFIPQNGG